MELPQPDALETPHALHKCIEEFQLRRLNRFLPEDQYSVISVKGSKLHLLPRAGSVQNPVFEAKDVSRYPGTAVRHAHFRDFKTIFMHDVSSEVTPHELVEKLSLEQPDGHLFVTGINPIEVIDRACTFEPSSHSIEYDLRNFNFVFTDSESEAYMTSIDTTVSWLRTSSVCASNGRVYHVVLLEYKLGHCLWHIFSDNSTEQHTRTFSTGSFVQLPAPISGTLKGEYLPVKILSGILDFVRRTPDLSTRNLSAKVTQVANAINPKTTSRERWIATHVASLLAPYKTWDWYIKRTFWNSLYFLSLQWQMLGPLPDIYSYIDERKRTRVLHPTPGGGWSHQSKCNYQRSSIPNNPTSLQRLSAFTGAVFTYLLPKILIGEVLSEVIIKLDYWNAFTHLVKWADIRPVRLVLTASIICVTAIIPGHIVKVFSRLSGHFWRQLWLPGWMFSLTERLITEICGAPGYSFLRTSPGRGWSWQAYLWALGLYTILPGLIPCVTVPWLAWQHGQIIYTLAWWLAIALENLLVLAPDDLFYVPDDYMRFSYFYGLTDWLSDTIHRRQKSFGFKTSLWHSMHPSWHVTAYSIKRAINWLYHQVKRFQNNTGSINISTALLGVTKKRTENLRVRNIDTPLPAVMIMPANIPGAPAGVALAVDPIGMNYVEWLAQVRDAYNQNTQAYPLLTPGRSCFWDCVAQYGGTAHMWYSWYMAFTQKLPDPLDDAIGAVTVPEMQVFAAISRFGLNLSGLIKEITHAQGSDWPTLHLNLGRSVIRDMLHVELAAATAPTSAVGNLAKILRTIRVAHPQWDQDFQQAFNHARADSVARPTPFLMAVAGSNEIPDTLTQVADAIMASYDCAPIDNENPAGFSYDHLQRYQEPYPQVYTFDRPMGIQKVAATPPAKMWKKFTSVARGLRLLVPKDYCHPKEDVKIKVGNTSSQRRDNRQRNNQRPDPPRWVALRDELSKQLDPYKGLVLPLVPLQEELLDYTADIQSAIRLMSDLKAHPSVLETHGDSRVLQSLDSVLDLAKLKQTKVTKTVRAYLGVWGSGKTAATCEYLRSLTPALRSRARIVSHTESLRAQAKWKLDFPEMNGYNFPTLASILTEPSSGPVIFDDAGKFWGGVLDLVMLTNPMVTEIVINGDPAQGQSKFPLRGSQSENDLTPIASIAKFSTKYATLTHRGFQLLSNTLGVYTTNPLVGHITHTVGPKAGIPVCTASPRYVQVLSGGGRQAYTYESVQGEDFKTEVEVDMTGLEGAVMDPTAYVAMTRSSKGLYLHLDAADPNSTIKAPPTGSDLMNALIYSLRESNSSTLPCPSNLVKAAFYRHLSWSMPMLPWFATVGASVPASLFQSVSAKAASHEVVDFTSTNVGIVDNQVSSSGPIEAYIPEIHFIDKEHREANTSRGQTDQFKETCFVNPHVHKRGDTPTYFKSVSQRLVPSSFEQNSARMSKFRRQDMCDEYDKLVSHPPKWTAERHVDYIDRSVDEYCSKRTVQAVLQKLQSHNSDRSGSDIKITLKNQVIKKEEKRNKVEAIAGQLIHEYDISQTLEDAPYALFMEDEIISSFPDNFLFYRRMSPSEFIEAYKKRWRVDNGVHSSDVTRWDTGCDAAMLNFDVHVMRRSCFPAEYVEDYIHRRLTSRSQHGVMATMQNSGDRYTWPLNSIRRAVVASLVCHVTSDDTVAINGDDEAIDRCLDAETFPNSPWEFKDQNGYRGEFSGFELGGETPVYSARGIHYRCMILVSRDPSAQDKWVNYLDLLQHCNLDEPEAIDVARAAHAYMHPELFAVALPPPLQPLFPEVSFEVMSS